MAKVYAHETSHYRLQNLLPRNTEANPPQEDNFAIVGTQDATEEVTVEEPTDFDFVLLNKALFFIAQTGDYDWLIPKLVDSGADVNTTNSDGDTPLHEAARNGHFDVVKALIIDGADANIENHNGFTPLSLAIAYKHSSISRALRPYSTH